MKFSIGLHLVVEAESAQAAIRTVLDHGFVGSMHQMNLYECDALLTAPPSLAQGSLTKLATTAPNPDETPQVSPVQEVVEAEVSPKEETPAEAPKTKRKARAKKEPSPPTHTDLKALVQQAISDNKSNEAMKIVFGTGATKLSEVPDDAVEDCCAALRMLLDS